LSVSLCVFFVRRFKQDYKKWHPGADAVIGDLESDYGKNFLDGNDNGAESIWAVQFSINDGTNAEEWVM
jgi:hypothetical protein